MHEPQCTRELSLPDEAATQRLGGLLARCIRPGLVIYLEGDLGAGKTTLVRALLRALGHTGPVKSPTYALVEVYVISSLYLYHFDFYRFGSPEEFVDAGLGEYFRGDSVCLVEWPEKAAGYVPPADLRLAVGHEPPGRRCRPLACSEEGQQCLTRLYAAWDAADSCISPGRP
ncbi:tRNA (adenosine(37)-N6)-threonylcarbamoyltransferase complex ATPase subunit type 1 TsaE [Azovibrio restrictus]|uniref:tRNA (adenosine(37)-N6)-threonylcarbamoyltransferase complex ATPase subunit type 1 TsaE n=1 Tax=Azovibrio restrictus TaxID=146938 RepID=UPI0026ED9B8E|nr:tRNA (adenosine(37)-N6)-threonylcarbamoyltransferase complex ATPase subunit type 1 TsaE [Azovibrio restrictus]